MALGQIQFPDDVYKSHSQATPLILSNNVLDYFKVYITSKLTVLKHYLNTFRRRAPRPPLPHNPPVVLPYRTILWTCYVPLNTLPDPPQSSQVWHSTIPQSKVHAKASYLCGEHSILEQSGRRLGVCLRRAWSRSACRLSASVSTLYDQLSRPVRNLSVRVS